MIIEAISELTFDAFWPTFRDVVRAQETYAYAPDLDREAARQLWCEIPERTFVAIDRSADGDVVVGSYYLKPNGAGPGGHVCNCGYMVAAAARGRGVATRMCEHSRELARRLGYRAMQLNAVVSTNESAVQLWQRLGFEIIGRVPEGFRHPRDGFVDTLIMYQRL
ncbi:MAG: GNAT family N-acetyltransferase [Pseudomonadales bacterium]|jgi:RimJ/RimL family protein N-acetyltransferase|nr:GNAT family N-acetyltransferase [Pseudomonadales bacterium]